MWSISEIDASDPHVEEARSALRVLALCHDLTKRTDQRANEPTELAKQQREGIVVSQLSFKGELASCMQP